MNIISLVNQKGGVSKTTSTHNIGAALSELGKKVLLVDLDPQGNLTSGTGIVKMDLDKCISALSGSWSAISLLSEISERYNLQKTTVPKSQEF